MGTKWTAVLALGLSLVSHAGAQETPQRLRVALFNVMELSAEKLAQVDAAGAGSHPQLLAAARILQKVRPDILVLQEVDLPRGPQGEPAADLAAPAKRFVELYLRRGPAALDFPHAFAGTTNTGMVSGVDLDRNGKASGWADRGQRGFGEDCLGFGTYPGQYSMAVLSRFPLEADKLRSFQRLLWKDLPGSLMPLDWYSPAAQAVLPVSSKSHWDLPVVVGGRRLHLLISHPTPPAFDGPEDRNGRRNFDEIRLWKLYLDDEARLVDDQGRRGGYGSNEPFVVIGDLNSDPVDGDPRYEGKAAIRQLLEHPRVQDNGPHCASLGAVEHARAENPQAQPGAPRFPERATATFLGGHRVDYVLPAKGLTVADGGVFWPSRATDPEGHAWAEAASDHRLVWVDLTWPPSP
jgi:endonuclease/exonuclease/phosphatase family metal-dependent hydrolase